VQSVAPLKFDSWREISVNDLIRSAIGYAIVIAIIVGVTKLYKSQTKVVIDPNDHSMKPEEYPYGSYSLKTDVLKSTDFQVGDVVAYYVPGKPAERVGRVVAQEGQLVEVEINKNARVDGQTTNFKSDQREISTPEIRVPRGCLFIMHDKSYQGEDSIQVGPIPYYNIKGKLN
jgi:signal peptidase I